MVMTNDDEVNGTTLLLVLLLLVYFRCGNEKAIFCLL